MVPCHCRHAAGAVDGDDTIRNTAGYVGLNALEYIRQTVSEMLTALLAFKPLNWLTLTKQYFKAVLYASAPENFNTTHRASASGMLSCLGRIAAIVDPYSWSKIYRGRDIRCTLAWSW